MQVLPESRADEGTESGTLPIDEFDTVLAMSEPQEMATPERSGTLRRVVDEVRQQSRWKKFALALSAVSIMAGFVLMAVESGSSGTENPGVGGAAGPAASGLVPSQEGPAAEAGAADEDDGRWAPVFLRFGFSFFIGFAIGSAMRTVLRVVLLFVGLFAMAQFALTELGFIEVHWARLGEEFDGFFDRVGDEAGSIKGLFTGRLPSAGLAMLGLYAGLRRG